MRAKNACKTCALGMGGQAGGMVNEAGHFPEFCKKSLQAMTSDMQGKIEARFFEAYSLEDLKAFSSRELEACGRLSQPVIARPGDTHYRPISWEEALDEISGAMKATSPERAFFYASGRSSNEAGFLLQLLARCYGTNHVSNCSYYCHQASGVGLSDAIGTGTATVDLEDINRCDLLFLIGGNPASNHPRLMGSLVKLRARGGKVIVVNPVRETGLVNFRVPSNVKSMLFGSEIASTYLQVRIGGDVALFAGIAKALLARGATDPDFISTNTEGFSSIRDLVEGLAWEEIERACGVPRQEIEDAAATYAASERTIFSWTMGITHHEHGVENVQWIVNLALLRGMVGKPGAGLMPIRGHSNVQGMGSVGVYPGVRQAVLDRMAALGVRPPAWKGHDTMEAMEASERGEMDFALCLGGNLFGANPDATFASKAMSAVDTVVYLNTTLNTGHAHGCGKTTIILPVQARDEEAQSTTQESMFSYVRLSDGGPQRIEGLKSEVEIISELGERTARVADPKPVLDWKALGSHDLIRAMIARLVPELEEIEHIGKTKKEFHIPGRLLHEPRFGTPSGKAAFHAHPMPHQDDLKDNQLRLMTVRSEGQFNTVVYEEEDIYRDQDRRDVILMNSADRQRLGLATDQPVIVENESGRMVALARDFDIAEGCALMYYPEANVLIPRKVDPRSKTPAFKSAVVSVSPYQGPLIKREMLAAGRGPSGPMNAC